MRRIAILAIGLVFASSPIGQARAADTTGVTQKSIKIGLFGPITGPSSAQAKALYGAIAVYRDINERGGINGRQLELVIEDDGCDAKKGVAAAQKLIAQDKVFLLHGASCSAVGVAIRPEIEKQPAVPYVVLSASNASISSPVLRNIFHPTLTAKIMGERMADFALSKPGARRIGIVRHSDEWAESYASAAIARLKEKGVEPVKTVAFERGGKDVTGQAQAMKEAQPDVVLGILYPAEFSLYIKEAYKSGIKATTLGTGVISIDDVDKQVGIPAAISDVYAAYRLAGLITSPRLAPYAKIFKKYYPAESLDTLAFDATGGAIAIVEVLKRLGARNVSRERFIAEMNKLNNFDTGIQSGTLTFSKNDHVGLKDMKMIALVNKRPKLFTKYGEAEK